MRFQSILAILVSVLSLSVAAAPVDRVAAIESRDAAKGAGVGELNILVVSVFNGVDVLINSLNNVIGRLVYSDEAIKVIDASGRVVGVLQANGLVTILVNGAVNIIGTILVPLETLESKLHG